MTKFRVVIETTHGGLALDKEHAIHLAERIAFEEGVASRVESHTEPGFHVVVAHVSETGKVAKP